MPDFAVCLAVLGLNSGNAATMRPASFVVRFDVWECNLRSSVVLCECETWSVSVKLGLSQ